VRAARQAFDDSAWSRARPRERQNLLWRLADLMERDAQQLAELECLNNGKSAAVAKVMDVQLAIDFLRYMAGWATKIEGSTVEASMPLMPNDQFHGSCAAKPWVWSAPSSPGTSRCCWLAGSSARPWPPAAPWCSSRPTKPR
jgi:aldehyde dehydrogenase (acceptor) (EC 1.2.99.3)